MEIQYIVKGAKEQDRERRRRKAKKREKRKKMFQSKWIWHTGSKHIEKEGDYSEHPGTREEQKNQIMFSVSMLMWL